MNTLEKVRSDKNAFAKLPKHMKTREVCLEAIKVFPENISYVPWKQFDDNFCKEIILEVPNLLLTSYGKSKKYFRTLQNICTNPDILNFTTFTQEEIFHMLRRINIKYIYSISIYTFVERYTQIFNELSDDEFEQIAMELIDIDTHKVCLFPIDRITDNIKWYCLDIESQKENHNIDIVDKLNIVTIDEYKELLNRYGATFIQHVFHYSNSHILNPAYDPDRDDYDANIIPYPEYITYIEELMQTDILYDNDPMYYFCKGHMCCEYGNREHYDHIKNNTLRERPRSVIAYIQAHMEDDDELIKSWMRIMGNDELDDELDDTSHIDAIMLAVESDWTVAGEIPEEFHTKKFHEKLIEMHPDAVKVSKYKPPGNYSKACKSFEKINTY